ncbi:BtpA/SgcQ family protein [Candidatus Zixiibacteriota bacterium]
MADHEFDMTEVFSVEKPLIGVVHLMPLPGSPRYAGSMEEVGDRALRDAHTYARGGLHGLILENYGDLPFFPEKVYPETVAAMAVVADEVRREIDLPMGINVLRNDAIAALGLATVLGAPFMRVNVLMGAMVTDQGIIQGQAHRLLRRRSALGASTKIFADVMVKHAQPLADQDLEISTRELIGRGLADALIVTGRTTGGQPVEEELRLVKSAAGNAPVLVGSGLTVENAGGLLAIADGAIVGTSLKKDGQTENEVNLDRVKSLVDSLGR